MLEMEFPLWRQRLARSLHINRSQVQSKYYQVASVCPNGRPKNRTMVFRGFLAGTQSLLSVTDLRSEKASEWQIENNAHFEICWYFSGSREQYRLAGEVALLSNSIDYGHDDVLLAGQTKESILKQQWSNLSSRAQEPFFSSTPKAPFDIESENSNNQGSDSSNESDSNNSAITKAADIKFEISENFGVVIFIPHSVDYLNLKSKPQERCLYDIQDAWKEVFVNP